MTTVSRINIAVTADDQTEGELVSRLIAVSLTDAGFEDVTNTSGHHTNDQEEEVVEAMRNLNPEIFNSEVTIDTQTFEEVDGPELVAAAGDEPGPGVDEFPEAEPEPDDIPEDD